MAKPPKINVTRNYDLFRETSGENRPLDLKRHRALDESIRECGFIPAYPIICERDDKGRLTVKDGQHRLAFAKKHQTPVYWIEDDSGFDVAAVNNTQKGWQPMDYAGRFAAAGGKDYAELIEFKTTHGIPLTIAAALLAGQTTFHNLAHKFYNGEFVVTDRAWANSVVAVYLPVVKLDKSLKNGRFLLACMAAARVKGFSAKRFSEVAQRAPRNYIGPYSTRDAYLDMIEKIYNYQQKNIFAIKIEAIKAMRERNPRTRGKDNPEPSL
jgi:hypothetical protein